MQGAKQEV